MLIANLSLIGLSVSKVFFSCRTIIIKQVLIRAHKSRRESANGKENERKNEVRVWNSRQHPALLTERMTTYRNDIIFPKSQFVIVMSFKIQQSFGSAPPIPKDPNKNRKGQLNSAKSKLVHLGVEHECM